MIAIDFVMVSLPFSSSFLLLSVREGSTRY